MAPKQGTTGIVQYDEQQLRQFLDQRVREAVVSVIEAVLEAEAQEMVQAAPYERTHLRRDRRNGKRKRRLDTRVGSVELKVPRLRMIPFQSSIIDRYRRMESSLEEALVEMYLQGVSTRRVTDITEALCGTAVSAGRLSRLNHKLGEQLEQWRERPLQRRYKYLYLDGMVLKARWAEHVERVSLLVAVGVNDEGHREVVGVDTGCAEDMASWHQLLRKLKLRGLREVDLVISDAHAGLRQAAEAIFPRASFQRCVFHFMRNVLTKVPQRLRPEVALALRAIFAQASSEDALAMAKRFVRDYAKRLPDAVAVLSLGIEDTLTYFRFPPAHWHCIRTNNPLERTLREVQRRLRVVGAFPDVASALLLATARLKWIQETKWADRMYLDPAHDKLAA